MDTPTQASDIVILLVEDFDGDAVLIQEKLRISHAPGYTVERTSSLAQTLNWLKNHSADVILLDMNIGDSNGLDTVNAVFDAADYAAIVVLTGIHDSNLGFGAIEAGAQDFLTKDEINARNLRRIVAYAISRRRFQLRQVKDAIVQYRNLALEEPETKDPDEPPGKPSPKPLTAALQSQLLDEYRALLKTYLDSLVVNKSKPEIDLRDFVGRLGSAGAGPKDVLRLHVAALEDAMANARPERARFLNTDGRLLALEVMGRLLAFYRAANMSDAGHGG